MGTATLCDVPPMTGDRQFRYLDPAAAALLARHAAPRRALFLDRDGVINLDHGHVCTATRIDWIRGAFELCRDAIGAGYLPVVATNQAGIARGLYDEARFLELTRWIHAQFARRGATLLATYYCPHHPSEGVAPLRQDCDCRKPAPGMFLRAVADLCIDPGGSLMIGDKPSDLQAAAAAGVERRVLFTGDELPAFAELLAEASGSQDSADIDDN